MRVCVCGVVLVLSVFVVRVWFVWLAGVVCVSFVCRSCVRVAKCDKHCELVARRVLFLGFFFF